MMARGRCAAIAASALVEGDDLRIDARLAHAARDELRHLAAEIDDEDADLACHAVLRSACGRRSGR
jgi:hypothetical protein